MAFALKDVTTDPPGDVVANHLVVLVARTESVIVHMDAVHKAVI